MGLMHLGMWAALIAGDGGRAEELRELERQLAAPRPETRRAAVKQLVELGQRPAWELVCGALADADSQVADAAQVALARLDDARLLEELSGRLGLRHRDPWVRLRVAEAFGRLPRAIDGLELLAVLEPREPELARTLLWTLERQLAARRELGPRDKLAREVERLVEARIDPEVRGRALVVLARLEHFRSLPHVADCASAREPVLRCAALEAVEASGGWSEPQRLEQAVRGLADPEPEVRTVALSQLETLSTKPALIALARQLALEKRPRLRWRIQAFLRARSGEDHGADAAAWEAWANTVQGPWSTGPELSRRATHTGTGAQLAGLGIVSDRVAFLIDFSGSTWDTKVGDRTRKQVLDQWLREALEALPPETRFNVVPYTNDPLPWERNVVPAQRANIARALESFERSHARGRGNFYDAAVWAMSDPEVDTIVALTDGVPTGGRRYDMDLMVELLVERNRFRRIAFDSILVDAPKPRRAQWERLAHRTGGLCVEAQLD